MTINTSLTLDQIIASPTKYVEKVANNTAYGALAGVVSNGVIGATRLSKLFVNAFPSDSLLNKMYAKTDGYLDPSNIIPAFIYSSVEPLTNSTIKVVLSIFGEPSFVSDEVSRTIRKVAQITMNVLLTTAICSNVIGVVGITPMQVAINGFILPTAAKMVIKEVNARL